ncbi:efflux RND transporter periplasmic adaptor subunit [Edaphobacter aggregans]|uniref:efflux RND transporter periplasmic adaptor subunit n=1 Tax=Edaphobacter aggregans TaxID=570835 RepID=UPI000691CF1E|nr:efflux RND transporter periplasmic adaptor subunit [Edaphobacter aggregans]
MPSAPISEQEPRTTLPAREPQLPLPEPEKPGSGIRKWLVLLIVAGVVGAAMWKIRKNMEDQTAQGQKMAAMLDRPIPVQTALVQQRTMPIYLTQLGTVTAYNTVTIKSRVDGQLIRVNVREGEHVRQGQLLAEIDPAPYQAALAQAEGQLARDQAQHTNDQAQADRYKALFQTGVVSQENAQIQQSAAGQSGGAIKADQAAIEAAMVNLNYTKITAPINGVVGLRQVDPGNIVHASDTNGLLVVTQLEPISVIFTLPEDHLPEVLDLIRKGRKLMVEAYDRSGANHLATGSVLTVDNQIDPTTGTVKVKAVFDNKDGALFPNQFVNVRLILEQRPNAIVIPAAALLSGSQGSFVYVVKPGDPPADLKGANPADAGKAGRKGAGAAPEAGAGAGAQNQPHFYVEARPVKVDLTEGSQIILTGGVQSGEPIVVDGQEKLREGSRVIPRQAANPNGPRAVNPNRADTGVGAASQPQQNQSNPSQGAQSGRQGRAGGQQP